MAIARQYAISVGVTPTPLDGTQYPTWRLKNNGSNPVYIGDENVTTATGYPLPNTAGQNELIPVEMANKSLRGHSADRLYGVVAAGTEDVRVLVEGRVNP